MFHITSKICNRQAPDDENSPNTLTSLTQNPNQLHVIVLGAFGGIFGAICSEVLVALLYGSDPHPAFSSKVFDIEKICQNFKRLIKIVID
jgi:hypothetical protein